MFDLYSACNLCPRECLIDRNSGAYGICGRNSTLDISLASLHMWEEPCISGENGSGTIFFEGCSLGCIYCQNFKISRKKSKECKLDYNANAFKADCDNLCEKMLHLQNIGANNINLVTPTHFVPTIISAIKCAKLKRLHIPIVYNTSGYEKIETLNLLKGYVDIFLADLKYLSNDLAKKYSFAEDYPKVAKGAIANMVSQQPDLVYDENGLLKKGVIVRHLILPNATNDSKRVIRYLYKKFGDKIIISIMNQYTPLENVANIKEINRKITEKEYDEVVDYAISLGITNAFIQDDDTASESFIPNF